MRKNLEKYFPSYFQSASRCHDLRWLIVHILWANTTHLSMGQLNHMVRVDCDHHAEKAKKIIGLVKVFVLNSNSFLMSNPLWKN